MNERKKASTKATVQKSTKEKLTEALLRGRSAPARQFKPPESWEELAKIYRHCLDLAANSEPRERNKILALFRTVQKSKGGRPPLRPEISYEELVEKIDQQIADRRASTGKKPARKLLVAEWYGKPLAQFSVKENQQLQTILNKLSTANTSSRKPK